MEYWEFLVKIFGGLEHLGEIYPLAALGQRGCGDKCRDADDPEISWGCTRPSGHNGPHVAHITTGRVVYAWTNAQEPTTGVAWHEWNTYTHRIRGGTVNRDDEET